MILNPELAKKVRQAWIDDQEKPNTNREVHDYPEEEQLFTILDLAFRVSLRREEGRPIQGSLMLISPYELDHVEIPCRRDTQLVVRFKEPINIDADSIAKLISVTEVGASSLMFSWFNGDCKAWGIIYYHKNRLQMESLHAAIQESRHIKPETPTFDVVSTGTILISRSNWIICSIVNGEFVDKSNNPKLTWGMSLVLRKLFVPKLNNEEENSKYDHAKGGRLASCVEYLLYILQKKMCGGIVIIVPDDLVASAHKLINSTWDINGGLEFQCLLDVNIANEMVIEDYSFVTARVTEEHMRERLDALACLASLDGALVLTSKFDLVGFGVKLKAPDHSEPSLFRIE